MVNVDGFLRCACPFDRFEAFGVAHTFSDIAGGFNSNDMLVRAKGKLFQ